MKCAQTGAWALLIIGWLVTVASSVPAQTALPSSPPTFVASLNLPAAVAVEPMIQLDSKRLFALGMIETGNDDHEIGRAGEVSRYQIEPGVWRVYSKSDAYENPQVAREVARRHWTSLANYFKKQTGRNPDDFDMYVLWNTTWGYYAKRDFSRRSLSRVVHERAERFVNLVNRKD